MNVFEAVKQSVTTRQAAEMYGIKVNRNGMAVCPFHNDRKCRMKPIRQTGFDNVCSAAAPIRWTSYRLTVPATVGSCPSWYTQSEPRHTFWKMKLHREPTLI